MNKRANEIMTETELVAACKRKEMWARKALYEQFAPAMLSVCTRYTGNSETARDIMQDAFIKVFTKIGDFRGEGNFEGWLRKIFVTTALENLRKQRFVSLGEEHIDTIEDDDFSAFEKLSADDLHEIISELPPTYRAVFNLRAVEGYEYAEIAQIFDTKEVTVRSQFLRARQILQEKVREFTIFDF